MLKTQAANNERQSVEFSSVDDFYAKMFGFTMDFSSVKIKGWLSSIEELFKNNFC
jgi:hypothetical protein